MNALFIIIIIVLILAYLYIVLTNINVYYKQPSIKIDNENDIIRLLNNKYDKTKAKNYGNEYALKDACYKAINKIGELKVSIGLPVVVLFGLIYYFGTLDSFHEINENLDFENSASLLYSKICTWLSFVAFTAFVVYCISGLAIENKDEHTIDGYVFAAALSVIFIVLITNVLLLKFLVSPPVDAQFDIIAFAYIRKDIGIYNLWQTIIVFLEALVAIVMRWANKIVLKNIMIKNQVYDYYTAHRGY